MMFAYLKGRPIPYAFASVYGFIFALFFLVYGGVKVILSFMDHNYETLRDPILFTIIGAILIAFAMAFRDLKNWGRIGLIIVNALVILVALFGITRPENIALVILSGAALYGLFAPATKECLAGQS
jgi:hypothetical protein